MRCGISVRPMTGSGHNRADLISAEPEPMSVVPPESYGKFRVLGNPAHDGRPPQPRRMTMQNENSILRAETHALE